MLNWYISLNSVNFEPMNSPLQCSYEREEVPFELERIGMLDSQLKDSKHYEIARQAVGKTTIRMDP